MTSSRCSRPSARRASRSCSTRSRRAAHRVAGRHSGRAQRDADRPADDERAPRRTARRSTSSAPAPTSTTSRRRCGRSPRAASSTAPTRPTRPKQQGTLQLIYEYQTMITSLTGMDVSNASLYDGASARGRGGADGGARATASRKSLRILVPTHRASALPQGGAWRPPATRACASRRSPYARRARSSLADLEKYEGEDITALVIQQPNFFGVLEDVDALTDWAHANGILVIAVGEPDVARASSSRRASGAAKGADIACGDGQPLGVPLSSGGPYCGFLTTQDGTSCARCRAASSAAPSTPTASRASR